MEIEDKIKLTNITEVFIENLYKALHQFEDDQFILILIDDGYEVETGESLVYYLVLIVIKKITHLWISCYY
jgi:hypothetical protein